MTANSSNLTPIPQPRGWPIVGNLLQMPARELVQYFTRLAPQFDGAFNIDFMGQLVTFAYTPAMVAELADGNRFRKQVGPPLSMLRKLAGDGLFTADTSEPNWGSAHRILIAGFGQRAMRGYFDAMLDVSNRLVHKWQSKLGQDIAVTADMTRLTFDTIALCGFGYRFGSFESEVAHPFIEAMNGALAESMLRLTRIRMPIAGPITRARSKKFEADIALMNKLVDEVIVQRRKSGSFKGDGTVAAGNAKDLLDLMLQSKDPKTGEALSDLNMRYQVITFLIAGHETTSGLLSFAIYYLLKNPGVMAAATAEVDNVLAANTAPDYHCLAKLDIIDRVIKETLRLWPTAPIYSVSPYENTVIGGKFAIKKDQRVNVLLPALHKDASIWHEPERFNIDRFLPEQEAKIPAHAYKPFGNGDRACIGRQFAITEAKLALALILQKFNLIDEYKYEMKVNETLTLKPEGFRIRAISRT